MNKGPKFSGLKIFTVFLLTLLLVSSASAKISWIKEDGQKYLAWDNGSESKEIFLGQSANFATGYFYSTTGKARLIVTINNKEDGKIVSTLFSGDVITGKEMAYKVFTVSKDDYQKAGEYILTIKISDKNSLDHITEEVDYLYLKIKPNLKFPKIPVIPLNSEPVMNNIRDKTVYEAEELKFKVTAVDKENDKLTFESRVGINIGSFQFWFPLSFIGASFDADKGEFSWTPSYDAVKHPNLSRLVEFSFRAHDGKKYSEWSKAMVTVKDVNRNPIFDLVEDKTIDEGETLVITVDASDADGDELAYSIADTNLPKYDFDAQEQKLTFTPYFNQAGEYFVTFKVEDDFGGEDLEEVKITVLEAQKERPPQCDDGIDNDGDEKIDFPDDPGCEDKDDDDEKDEEPEKPQCDDGIDNDGDGKIDFPDDPGCKDKNDDDEKDPKKKSQCDDGIDNDGDGKIDFPDDPGCKSKKDNLEKDSQCIDQIDNDGDGLIDYPEDPGCSNPDDNSETPVNKPQCSDGKDNDGDGKIDFPDDLGCSSKEDDNETNDANDDAKLASQFTNLKFKSVFIEDDVAYAGDTMAVHVSIVNNGKTDLDDVEIQATIYEIGLFGSTSDFYLAKGKPASRTIYAYVPEDAQPGWYLVKITAKNYHYHTSIYRIVHINSNTFQ